MQIVFVETYYRRFLAKHYAEHPSLESEGYEKEKQSLIDAQFGGSNICTPLGVAQQRNPEKRARCANTPIRHG
jgi:hypothetical protein